MVVDPHRNSNDVGVHGRRITYEYEERYKENTNGIYGAYTRIETDDPNDGSGWAYIEE